MAGLYREVTDEFSELEHKIYNKSSMVAVSHAIEDAVLEFELSPRMYVFFQKEKFFLKEIERYKRLDEICSSICLFADKFSAEVKEKFSEKTHFFDLNKFSQPLQDNLKSEWIVIVQHPQSPMALLTRELPEKQKISQDAFRQFKGNLTFQPEIIDKAVNRLKTFISRENMLEVDSQYFQPLPAEEKEYNIKTSRFIAPFLNNALEEIEEKVNTLASQNVMLNYSLQENERRTKEIIKRLCFAAEYKDEDTTIHLVRIGLISTLLYSRVVNDEVRLERMFYGSLMHDIGKIGIPDQILFKPGSLTDEEYEKIKQHPEIALNILRDSDHKLIKMAQKIAYTHHERWDGEGYPRGLAGEDIPLAGRIVAIVDVFDALMSERVYKEAYSLEKTLNILEEERNEHFDGDLLDIFRENLDKILSYRSKIRENFSGLGEKEVAAKYFKLNPDFSLLTEEKIPEYNQLFNNYQYEDSQREEMKLYVSDYPAPPFTS